MGFYSAIEKNEMMNFSGKWKELENPILREVSQSQKDNHHMFSFNCGS